MNEQSRLEAILKSMRYYYFGLCKKGLSGEQIEGIFKRGINKELTKKDLALLESITDEEGTDGR